MTDYELIDIFSRNLNRIMNERGISQREMAKMAGCSATTIHRYVHGQHTPLLLHCVNICKALNIPVNALLRKDSGK